MTRSILYGGSLTMLVVNAGCAALMAVQGEWVLFTVHSCWVPVMALNAWQVRPSTARYD